ncbi:MAG: ABC transporter ATP-binding protein [bacterium]|nr:ABC transporter ATP-binding protein [bacterium]
MTLIEARGIYKSYINGRGELRVLEDITLKVEQGKIFSIVGASGAGKSTLLHILGALDRPSRGELWYNNSNLFSLSDRQLARFRNQKVGFVFQFHHLLPEFTAQENVMMPIIINRQNRTMAELRAQQLLAEVGLQGREHHKPGELSGGEQQRVAIARALSNQPELLLADEPTGNLDSKTSEKIYALLQQINREHGVTIIMVTHNEILGSRADYCLKLSDGKLQFV